MRLLLPKEANQFLWRPAWMRTFWPRAHLRSRWVKDTLVSIPKSALTAPKWKVGYSSGAPFTLYTYSNTWENESWDKAFQWLVHHHSIWHQIQEHEQGRSMKCLLQPPTRYEHTTRFRVLKPNKHRIEHELDMFSQTPPHLPALGWLGTFERRTCICDGVRRREGYR